MKTTSLFFFLLVAGSPLFFLHCDAGNCFWTFEYTVRIINQLPSGSDKLKIHCASKDNDLGYHNLTTSSNPVFAWKFCDDVFARTLFFCHLWWEPEYTKSFDAFTSRNADMCRKDHVCNWIARADGIYFTRNMLRPAVKQFNWEPIPDQAPALAPEVQL